MKIVFQYSAVLSSTLMMSYESGKPYDQINKNRMTNYLFSIISFRDEGKMGWRQRKKVIAPLISPPKMD